MKTYLITLYSPPGPPPEDLDTVLGWASRIAEVTGLPLEVRPFQDEYQG